MSASTFLDTLRKHELSQVNLLLTDEAKVLHFYIVLSYVSIRQQQEARLKK
jgi:hypothetical protein